MRERLIQYVELLFAGAPNSTEIKQEILQNTLDRFDDLVAQGKSEEAAYRLAISGIGDINEILDTPVQSAPLTQHQAPPQEAQDNSQHRKMRAVAIAMYICSAIPLFILGELGNGVLGLCMTTLLVAAATYLLLLTRKPGTKEAAAHTPQDSHKKAMGKLINAVTVILYLLVSFTTGAWLITWLIFPIAGCVEGLINAIHDLKEACENED